MSGWAGYRGNLQKGSAAGRLLKVPGKRIGLISGLEVLERSCSAAAVAYKVLCRPTMENTLDIIDESMSGRKEFWGEARVIAAAAAAAATQKDVFRYATYGLPCIFPYSCSTANSRKATGWQYSSTPGNTLCFFTARLCRRVLCCVAVRCRVH